MKDFIMKWMQAHALLRCSTVVAWRPSSYDALGGRNRVVASGYGNTRRPLTPGHQPADKNSAMSDSSSSSSSSSSHNFNKYYDPSTSFDFEAAAEYKPSTVPGKLRVVCVSDTHGFENRLGQIPEGDVLVHCGDFAPNRKVRSSRGRPGQSLENAPPDFASWILSQPHPFKIVVRGNHDPTRLPLAAANALFAYKPSLVTIANVTFSLAPYPTNKHKSIKSLSAHSEVTPGVVLVSHVPPYGVLDACVQDGKLIGDKQLRRKVHEWAVADNAKADATAAAAVSIEAAATVAAASGDEEGQQRRRKLDQGISCPSVWLCGHVHEGYGTKQVNFATPLPENTMRKSSNRSSKKKVPLKANSSKANSLAAKSRAMAAISAASHDHSSAESADFGLASEAGTKSSSAESPPLLQPTTASTTTLCLNVAVANDGRATSIEADRKPVVFTVDTSTHEVELA